MTPPSLGESVQWPIFAFRTIDDEWYWSMLEFGNRHGVGEGWLCVLPWGERRKPGVMYSGDNRIQIDSDDVQEMVLLGWTRPMSEYIVEYGEPICLEN